MNDDNPESSPQPPLFAMPDQFIESSHRHCAPLFLLRGQWPSLGDESATLTLVSHRGMLYALTAYHVVRRAAETDTSLATVRNEIQRFDLARFWQPHSSVPGGSRPDVSIYRISPEIVDILKGEAITVCGRLSVDPAHSIAVGYPTLKKRTLPVPGGGGFIESPGVHAIAEMSSISDSSFVCYSELPPDTNEEELSGMSGGPVFWTSEETYGLLGIITDAPTMVPSTSEPGEGSFGGGPRLIFRGERVTVERMDEWLRDRPSSL